MPSSSAFFAAARPVGLARRIGTAFLLVPAVAVVGFVLANVLIEVKLSSAKRVDVSLAGAPSGGGANYLLIGSDTRAFATNAADAQQFGTSVGGQRSDTIMVLHTDPGSDRALLVSFPRDLWVNIPGHGSAKLNSAFNYGPQSVIDTLSSAYNVPIQHYVEVNFASFRDIVNAIGTVPVYFPAPARDDFSLLQIDVPGCAQLDGQGALAFVRARHLELRNPSTGRWQSADPIPDIGRIARQQALLRVIGRQAMDAAFTNPLTANNVADAAIGHLTLDQNFGRTDVFTLADGLAGSADRKATTITIPTTSATRGGQSVLLPSGGSDAVLAQLRDFNTPVPAPAQPASGSGASAGGGGASASSAPAPAAGGSSQPASLAPVPGGC